jgi:hypothetical protein
LLERRAGKAVTISDRRRLRAVENHERAAREAGDRQVREAVDQTDVGVQVRDRRLAGDARVGIGRRDGDAFVCRQDHAHVRIFERRIEHRGLGAAGAREEQIDLPIAQDVEDRVRAVDGRGGRCDLGGTVLQLHY